MLDDIEAQLRRLEHTHELSGHRLNELARLPTPDAQQRAETSVLTDSLRVLALRIRRLRLALHKANGSAAAR
jgi:hypothetical protein